MADDLPEAGSFATGALTAAEFYEDLRQHVINSRKQRGLLPTTLGVTTPVGDAPTDGDGFVSQLDQFQQLQKQRRRARAYDANEEEPNETYAQRRFDFIEAEEGTRTRAYDDATGRSIKPGAKFSGKRTIGVGFNMDAAGARETYKRATGLDNFDDVRAGKATISRDNVRKLFDATISQAEAVFDKKFGDLGFEEHERLAIVSMIFNGGSALIGPNMTRVIQSKNKKEIIRRILFKSNRRKILGLAKRRYREATMFAGPTDAPTSIPKYAEYLKKAVPQK